MVDETGLDEPKVIAVDKLGPHLETGLLRNTYKF